MGLYSNHTVPCTEVAKTVAEEDLGLLDLTRETKPPHTKATDTRNTQPQSQVCEAAVRVGGVSPAEQSHLGLEVKADLGDEVLTFSPSWSPPLGPVGLNLHRSVWVIIVSPTTDLSVFLRIYGEMGN